MSAMVPARRARYDGSAVGKRQLRGFSSAKIGGKRNKQVQAIPRSSVNAPQGNIVSNIRILSMHVAYKERQQMMYDKNATYFGALNSIKAFEIQRGDLLFTIMGANTETGGANFGFRGDVNEKVYAHVGGLPTTTITKFAGFCDVSPHQFKLDNDPDEAGTIARGGTRMITWNSEHEIHAHEHFYYSMYPYSIKNNAGQELQAITEVGQADDKLRVSLYPLRETSLHCTMLEILDFIKTQRSKSGSAFDYKRIEQELNGSEVLIHSSADYPMRKWAYLATLREWLLELTSITATTTTLAAIVKQFDTIWHSDLSAEFQAFLQQIGDNNGGNYTTLAIDVDFVELKATSDNNAQYKLLLRGVLDAMMLVQNSWHAWLRAKMVGKALTSALPGNNCDIMIGYTYC
jgi:hypothetical protein